MYVSRDIAGARARNYLILNDLLQDNEVNDLELYKYLTYGKHDYSSIAANPGGKHDYPSIVANSK